MLPAARAVVGLWLRTQTGRHGQPANQDPATHLVGGGKDGAVELGDQSLQASILQQLGSSEVKRAADHAAGNSALANVNVVGHACHGANIWRYIAPLVAACSVQVVGSQCMLRQLGAPNSSSRQPLHQRSGLTNTASTRTVRLFAVATSMRLSTAAPTSSSIAIISCSTSSIRSAAEGSSTLSMM